MIKKRVLSLVLAAMVVGGTSSYIIYHSSAKTTENMKVMAYRPAAQKNENGYQIDKFEKVNGTAWINENEVLTLTKKGEVSNPDSTIPIMYCSVYNLNTKRSKDFKEVNIAEFIGVSPDKKYVLYTEARNIPKVGSEEWKKAEESGELLHKKVKLLNLTTGEITDLKTENDNSNAYYVWVSNSKILINYSKKWCVTDMSGKVYADGSYNAGKNDVVCISGADGIKDLGNSVEGKFYFTLFKDENEGGKLCTIDVKTKETKTIYTAQASLTADISGKTIMVDNEDNSRKKSADVKSIGAFIIDESGKKLHDIEMPNGKVPRSFVLSPDGSKAAFIEDDCISNAIGYEPDATLKVVDTKTGAVKEIVKTTSLKDKNAKVYNGKYKELQKDGKLVEKELPIIPQISNISWDSTGSSLSFNYGSKAAVDNTEISTYIVSFDN